MKQMCQTQVMHKNMLLWW